MPRQLVRNFVTSLSTNTTGRVLTASLWAAVKINFSMGVWFKSNDYRVNGQVTMTNGFNTTGYGIYLSGNATTDGSIMLVNLGVGWIDCGFKVQDNNWHQIMLTVGGSGNAVVYLDGVSRYTGTPTIGTPATRSGFFTDGFGQFKGLLDEGRFYSRELSGAEVSSLFYGGEPSPGPANWYKFNEGSGTTALDSGTNPLNGTAVGGTYPTYSTDVFILGVRTLIP